MSSGIEDDEGHTREVEMEPDNSTNVLSLAQAALDEINCAILATLADKSLTARDLVKRLHLPVTTCYSRLKHLTREGLVKESSQRTEKGNLPFKLYTSQFDSLALHYEGSDFHLDLSLTTFPGQNLIHHETVRPIL